MINSSVCVCMSFESVCKRFNDGDRGVSEILISAILGAPTINQKHTRCRLGQQRDVSPFVFCLYRTRKHSTVSFVIGQVTVFVVLLDQFSLISGVNPQTTFPMPSTHIRLLLQRVVHCDIPHISGCGRIATQRKIYRISCTTITRDAKP